MTEKLGPCPLCGGEVRRGTGAPVAMCENIRCPMPACHVKTWERLSVIAEQNRRRGEALEGLKRCRQWLFGPNSSRDLDAIEKMCEEALK